MNANDVIRIGRSRERAASTTASAAVAPLRAQLLGELDDQDGVLAREADQHHEADLAEDVVDEPAQPCGQQRAQDRERHREQDDERQREALVLRREHQEHEEQAEPEDDQRLAARRAPPPSEMPDQSKPSSARQRLLRGRSPWPRSPGRSSSPGAGVPLISIERKRL